MFKKFSIEVKIHWLLRIALAWCFIGHGAWGILQKEEWLIFFSPFGITPEMAFRLMPLIGAIDITMGILALIFPTRALLLWMALWTFWTATLRPIAGLGYWEVLERGGNFGPPIALLVWVGFRNLGWKDWFKKISVKETVLTEKNAKNLYWILAISIAIFMIGHGAFQAFQKKTMLLEHWSSIGMPPFGVDPGTFLVWVGVFEILVGLLIIVKPMSSLLTFVVFWKIGTELLYPIAGRLVDLWEFVERGGDYFSPPALILLLIWMTNEKMQKPVK